MSIGTDLHLDADRNVSGGIGHVRWTICAMLFAATSINCMDRQVLSILKPTLEHSIGMTEVGYGYVVDAFQIAYALGFLVAGRFVDKVGTRIGYIVIMAVWSLSAMAGTLANSVLEFAIVRFTLGLGQSGNFPAAIKTVAEWFPQSERSLATGIFNCGTNLGAILAPLYVPWVALHYGWHAAFLVTGVLAAIWIALWLTRYRKPADHPTLTSIELQHIYQEPARQTEPSVPLGKPSWVSPDVGIRARKVSHRSDLVVLSLLAPLLLQRQVSSQSFASGTAAGYRIYHFGRR